MIHFFGHSMLRRSQRAGDPDTFMDILEKKYDICPTGKNFTDNIVVCSEERILYFLKKVKNISCAVIFHSIPTYYFTPYMDRDNWKNTNAFEELELDGRHFNFYSNANKDKWPDQRESDLKITSKLAVNAVMTYESFYHSPDLAKNRFEGALVLIDRYCTAKKIPVIHCPRKTHIPSWFKFTSGIVDFNIQEYDNHLHPEYIGRFSADSGFTHDNRPKTNNSISIEGNQQIAEKLSLYLDQLLQNNNE